MTTGELENQLMEFNEDERFYQQYYNVKQDKWMLEDFLESLDRQNKGHIPIPRCSCSSSFRNPLQY